MFECAGEHGGAFFLTLIVIFWDGCILIFCMRNTDCKREQIILTRKTFLGVKLRTLDICLGPVF